MPLAAALEQLRHQLKMYGGTAGIGGQARHRVTVDHACVDAFAYGVVQAPADAADFFIVAQHRTRRAVRADPAEIHDKKLAALLDKIITRILRLLTRLGHLVEEEGVTYVADAHGNIDPDNLLAPLQAASCTYRIAYGPRAGRKVLSLQDAPGRVAPITRELCANAHGFSLHAGVHCAANQRSDLEQLCRYVTCPAIVNDRPTSG